MNTYDAIVAEARLLEELKEVAVLLDELIDEDDEVTGGFFYSDIGDYAAGVSELD